MFKRLGRLFLDYLSSFRQCSCPCSWHILFSLGLLATFMCAQRLLFAPTLQGGEGNDSYVPGRLPSSLPSLPSDHDRISALESWAKGVSRQQHDFVTRVGRLEAMLGKVNSDKVQQAVISDAQDAPLDRVISLKKHEMQDTKFRADCTASLSKFDAQIDLIVPLEDSATSDNFFFHNQSLLYALRSWQQHGLLSGDPTQGLIANIHIVMPQGKAVPDYLVNSERIHFHRVADVLAASFGNIPSVKEWTLVIAPDTLLINTFEKKYVWPLNVPQSATQDKCAGEYTSKGPWLLNQCFFKLAVAKYKEQMQEVSAGHHINVECLYLQMLAEQGHAVHRKDQSKDLKQADTPERLMQLIQGRDLYLDAKLKLLPERPGLTLCNDPVMLYADGDFRNAGQFPKGEYTASMFPAQGINDNAASAVRVPAGCKAVLYGSDHFSGWEVTLLAGELNHEWFVTSGAKNDDVSSIKVLDDDEGAERDDYNTETLWFVSAKLVLDKYSQLSAFELPNAEVELATGAPGKIRVTAHSCHSAGGLRTELAENVVNEVSSQSCAEDMCFSIEVPKNVPKHFLRYKVTTSLPSSKADRECSDSISHKHTPKLTLAGKHYLQICHVPLCSCCAENRVTYEIEYVKPSTCKRSQPAQIHSSTNPSSTNPNPNPNPSSTSPAATCPQIPRRLVSNHRVDLTKGEALQGKDRSLQENFRSAVSTIMPDGKVEFVSDDGCRSLLQDIDGLGERLVKGFNGETDGRLKSDVCRLAQLYDLGGIYIDTDIVPQLDVISLLQPCTTFATARTTKMRDTKHPPGFFQALIAVSPRHPLILKALEVHLQWYAAKDQHQQGTIQRVTKGNQNANVGTVLLRDAFQEWAGAESLVQLETKGIVTHSDGQSSQLFFEQSLDEAKQTLNPEVWSMHKLLSTSNNWLCDFVVTDIISRKAVFASRYEVNQHSCWKKQPTCTTVRATTPLQRSPGVSKPAPVLIAPLVN